MKLKMSVYNTLQVLGISLTDTTPLEDLFNKSNLNIDKRLDGFYEPTLFDINFNYVHNFWWTAMLLTIL